MIKSGIYGDYPRPLEIELNIINVVVRHKNVSQSQICFFIIEFFSVILLIKK